MPDSSWRPPFGAYLPIDRRLALDRGEELPDRTSGAALFADISGFTQLAVTLTRDLGPQRGAEEITRHLNRIYGALIDQAHRYHGSVIDFGGDAITCWFDDANLAPGEAANSVLLAATCALAMQTTVREIEAITTESGTKIPLSIKTAITAGPVRRFRIGDPEMGYIDAMAGSTLDRLAAAERQAHQGETVIDLRVAGRLGTRATFLERRVGSSSVAVAVLEELRPGARPAPWLPVPELSPEAVRQWLLPPVFRRLQRREGEYLAELRTTVSLFLRYYGLDLDADDSAGEKLDSYVRWVQSLLARYGGYLIDLAFGDKGNHFQASFGALMAHEDDPVRAVRTALELRHPPADLEFIRDIQIGISQGPTRTGAYGGPTRRTYGVQGVQVNVAARLMTWAGPGQILVTEPIARAASAVADFEPLGAVRFKGLATPMPTYRLRQAREFHSKGNGFATPIVGREVERAGLSEQLQALLHGQSSNAIVEGEAGIGKSRLMEEFVSQARKHGIPTLTGYGSAIEQRTAFHAWRPIFFKLLSLEEADDPVATREALGAHLAEDAYYLERAPLLNSVLPLELPDNELTRGMSGEVRLNNTGALLVHLLKMGKDATSPLVLVLDDAHWMDSASWFLLDRARRELSTVLLMIVTRPMGQNGHNNSLPKGYRRLLDAPETTHYKLAALSPEEAAALVRLRLGVQSLPQAVSQLIQKHAEGHPFFSEEMGLALRDAGLIRIVDGQAVLANGANLEAVNFPNTVQGVITSRVDQLSPGQQMTLKVASVFGRIFLFRALKDIHPVRRDRSRLADNLATLDRLAITQMESRQPDLTYSFRHAIIQDVAYNLLLYQQREELHRAVAQWYEKNHSDDLARFWPLLAYHWEQAGNVSKTIEYLGKAGEQSLRSYANQEAVGFLSKALTLKKDALDQAGRKPNADERLQLARWLRWLGEAQLWLGHLAESRAALSETLALLDRPVPASRPRLVWELFKGLLVQTMHRLRPGSYLGRATTEEADILLEAVRSYQLLAEIFYYASQRGLTLHAGLTVLNLAELAQPSPELARAYANMAVIAGLIPWHQAAASFSQRTLATARQVGDLGASGWAHLLIGTYEVGLGNWVKVIELAKQAIDSLSEQGDRRLQGLSVSLLALVPASQGYFKESYQLYREWYGIAHETSNIQHQAFALFGQGESILPWGKADEAADFARRGLAFLRADVERAVENRTLGVRGLGLLALASLRQGDRPGALKAAEEGLTLLLELHTPTRVTLLEGLSGIVETFLRLREAQGVSIELDQGVRAAARDACGVLRRYARVFQIAVPRAFLWDGLYHWLGGRPSRAQRSWQKSLAVAKRLEMPFEQALAEFEIGRHAESPEGAAFLQRALDGFETLGATYHRNQVTDLLNAG